ncbi:MAG: hypothetical protein WCB36_08635, partial [Burkholderiales bacterium]
LLFPSLPPQQRLPRPQRRQSSPRKRKSKLNRIAKKPGIARAFLLLDNLDHWLIRKFYYAALANGF